MCNLPKPLPCTPKAHAFGADSLMPEFITINGRRFERGACGEHLLNRYVMPSRTPIDVPVFVFRSKHTGPVVLLQAGMHNSQLPTALLFTPPTPPPWSSQTNREGRVGA